MIYEKLLQIAFLNELEKQKYQTGNYYWDEKRGWVLNNAPSPICCTGSPSPLDGII